MKRHGVKVYQDLGFRSHVHGAINIDLDAFIDRKIKRFMGDGAAFNYIAMQQAIDETNRRREKQIAFNKQHNIEPASIHKAIRDLTDQLSVKIVAESTTDYSIRGKSGLPKDEMRKLISELEKQMKEAAKNLEFEKAAVLRDQIYEIRTMIAEESNVKPWEKFRLLAGEDDYNL